VAGVLIEITPWFVSAVVIIVVVYSKTITRLLFLIKSLSNELITMVFALDVLQTRLYSQPFNNWVNLQQMLSSYK
jgi:hypothetical protein